MWRDINTNWQPYACMQTRILQVILLDPCCGRVNTSPLLCLTWMATYWRVEVAVSLSTPGKRSETKCYAYIVIAVIISEIQYTYVRKSFYSGSFTKPYWGYRSLLWPRLPCWWSTTALRIGRGCRMTSCRMISGFERSY